MFIGEDYFCNTITDIYRHCRPCDNKWRLGSVDRQSVV